MKYNLSRRNFLKGAAAAAAFPSIITSSALGGNDRPPASERITLGFIGVGGQGSGHLGGLTGRPDVQTLAVCDVDASRRERARERVNHIYAQQKESGAYKGCDAYGDFRELVARDDIDAVVIGSPDHWHALLSIAAMKAGKDVYCEKPHSASIAEGRAVCEAAKRYGRVFQTGSQERSGQGRYGCELARNGYIGKVHTIRTYLPTNNHGGGPKDAAPQPVPEGFDYDMWLGPAPWQPYHPARCHGSFRWIQDYSDGELTDRGAHVNDLAMWGNGTDRTGPVEIEARGEFPSDGLYNTPVAFHIEYVFANGVRMICASEDARNHGMHGERGIKFEGKNGWLFINIHGGHLSAGDPEILKATIRPDDIHLHRSIGGHAADWLNSIRARTDPVAPAEAGHRTSSLCHLGLIAMLVGRKLKWDPDIERFRGDSSANGLIVRPMRSPWRI